MAEPLRYELMRPQRIVVERARASIAVAIGRWSGTDLTSLSGWTCCTRIGWRSRPRASPAAWPCRRCRWGQRPTRTPSAFATADSRGEERAYGMDYPGFALPSLYIEESAMGVAVHEVIRVLKRQAFKVIVNGHGAANHRVTLQRVAIEQSEPGRVAVLLTGYSSGFAPPAARTSRRSAPGPCMP